MRHLLTVILSSTALWISLPNPVFAQSNEDLSVQFSRTIDHIKEHGVSVVPSSDGGSLVILETAFDTRSNAELRLLLGKDGMFTPETDLGRIAKTTGLQVFKVPASVDISGYNEVYVWNPQNKVVIGVAPLQ